MLFSDNRISSSDEGNVTGIDDSFFFEQATIIATEPERWKQRHLTGQSESEAGP